MASFGYTVKEIVSIPISPSNEILPQQVREFIKTLKEELIKDWCVQSWSKQLSLGPQGSRLSRASLRVALASCILRHCDNRTSNSGIIVGLTLCCFVVYSTR